MCVVLLVEDDERLADLVQDYLSSQGFTVFIESVGYNVARKVADLTPNILILDINLPGKDGLTICKEVRPTYDGPILMLTARDEDADQVLGFEYGADDYVIKPAEPRVLLARIKALLRRYQTEDVAEQTDYSIGCLNINVPARSVMLSDESINLSSHEFDMLIELVKSTGKIISREYLFNKIYGREYDGLDRTVDVRISHLRKKLGDNSQEPEKIKTVWGKGYLFVPEAFQVAV